MSTQVLKLTAVIGPGEQPGTFVGYIKELSGIATYGMSEQEVFEELETATGHMLDYKRDEALALLAQQTQQPAPLIKRMASLPFNIKTAELEAV